MGKMPEECCTPYSLSVYLLLPNGLQSRASVAQEIGSTWWNPTNSNLSSPEDEKGPSLLLMSVVLNLDSASDMTHPCSVPAVSPS